MTVARLRPVILALLFTAGPAIDRQGDATSAAEEETLSPELARLQREHRGVLDSLNGAGEGGSPLELDDPRASRLLVTGWSLAGSWAAAFLNAHPSPSDEKLALIFEDFAPKPKGVKSSYGDFLEFPDYWFEGSAVRIGTDTYVVRASYGRDTSTGNFLVVARTLSGLFEAVWNIKTPAGAHYGQGDEIGRWAHLTRRAYYNGPLEVERILPLTPGANRRPRFLVNAYQSAHGGTVLAQLSIWEWSGSEAKALLIKPYMYAADYDGFAFDGKTLRIRTKETLRLFSSCGMCPEPEGTWTLRITPLGVQDLGHRFAVPQYQWADELLSALHEGEEVTDLANATVVAAMKKKIRETQDSDAAEASPRYSWGLLDDCHVVRGGKRDGVFDLSLDEAEFRFSYVLRKGRPYFTEVQIRR